MIGQYSLLDYSYKLSPFRAELLTDLRFAEGHITIVGDRPLTPALLVPIRNYQLLIVDNAIETRSF